MQWENTINIICDLYFAKQIENRDDCKSSRKQIKTHKRLKWTIFIRGKTKKEKKNRKVKPNKRFQSKGHTKNGLLLYL